MQYGDSDSDDEDSSSEGEAVEERVPGSDYDSDKDPAWRPGDYKSPKQSKVSHVI